MYFRHMRSRALIASLLLAAYGATAVEAVVGQLRDGEVHHETVAAAAEHQADTGRGEHGHEDPATDGEHGPEHQHGTSGDHCTHTHSVSLPAAQVAFSIVTNAETELAPLPAFRDGAFATPLFHPPKA